MSKPISKALKTFYGIGDFGFSLMTQVEMYLFIFFLTNVAKFSLPMVALIGSITSITDAVLSPFYGGIIVGTKAMKWGRYRSWILVGPPLVVVLYIFQFTRISPNEVISAVIVCAGFILSHIVWNISWVANVSLIPLLANNSQERGLLSSRRGTWTALAAVFFSYIGSPLAEKLGEITGSEILGYTLLAGTMAMVMVIGYWIIFKLTTGYEPTGREANDTTRSNAAATEKVSVKVMLQSLFQNPPLIALLVSDFFRYMTNFIMTAAAAYYFTYVAQNMALYPVYLLVGGIAQVIGAFVSGILVKSLSTRNLSFIGLTGLAASLFLCKIFGLNVIMFFVCVSFARLFLGILSAVLVALYSDVAVYGEWKTGKNANAFVMGLMNISLKAAVISRGTVIPIVLATAGFVATADPATVNLALKNAVVNVFVLIPGICALIAGVIFILFYKLTEEKLENYQKEIDERKAKALS